MLIGAGVRFNPAVPSPASFNHMITHLTVAGQPVWLDTTAEIAPYRMLVSVIRDRQALVVPASGAAHLEKTPADPPFASSQTMDAVGTLDASGTSHSRLKFAVRGDAELLLRSAFRQSAPAQYNQVVQQLSYGIGYAGTTSNPEASRPEDTGEPFRISYDYEREKGGDWEHYRMLPQLMPVGLPVYQDSDPLVRALDLGAPQVETSKSAMKIPEGWGAVLPAPTHAKCAYISLDQTFRFEKGTVYAERRVEILKRKVPASDLKTYKKWAENAGIGNEQYIQLTRSGVPVKAAESSSTKSDAGKDVPAKADRIEVHGLPLGAPPVIAEAKPAKPAAAETPASDPVAGPPVMTAARAEAANLLSIALGQYQQQDWEGEGKTLDQAKALDPEVPALWSIYGVLAMMQGKMFEAIDDFKKEIRLHPDSLQAYMPLVSLQQSRGQKEDALVTMRAWAAADTADPRPMTMLVDALVAGGKAKEAVQVGEAALPKLASDPANREAFRLSLAMAQLKAGEAAKGKVTLEEVLAKTEDANVLNNAAYALADASVDLPLAESSVRKALAKLADQSRETGFDGDVRTAVEQRRSIAAAWDTLGWALFREGKAAEAERYLRAAALNSPGPETGAHLSAVAKAQHRNASPEKRPIPLGSANGRNGVAEYTILLRNGALVDLKASGNKTIPGARELVAKANFAAFFPPGSQMTLLEMGFVNCHSGVCELVLAP